MINKSKFEEYIEILNIKPINEVDFDKCIKETKINFVDDYGYLYSLSFGNLIVTIRRNGKPAIFFNNNPYTYENINNYLKINNINLELMDKTPKNAIVKLIFRCKEHNVCFERSWNSVKNGSITNGCCTGVTRYDYKFVYEYAKSQGIEVLSKEYKDLHSPLIFKCSCGDIFERRWDTFYLEGVHKCWKCSTNKTRHTYDSVKKLLLENDIELLSDTYVNSSSNIKIKYNKCGFITSRTLNSIRGGKYKCPHCCKKRV